MWTYADFRLIMQEVWYVGGRHALRISSYDHNGFLLEQVLGSGPHPHLFDDLLVQAGSLILQFAPASLGERVATLR